MRVEMAIMPKVRHKARQRICNVLDRYDLTIPIEDTFNWITLNLSKNGMFRCISDVLEVTNYLKLHEWR